MSAPRRFEPGSLEWLWVTPSAARLYHDREGSMAVIARRAFQSGRYFFRAEARRTTET